MIDICERSLEKFDEETLDLRLKDLILSIGLTSNKTNSSKSFVMPSTMRSSGVHLDPFTGLNLASGGGSLWDKSSADHHGMVGLSKIKEMKQRLALDSASTQTNMMSSVYNIRTRQSSRR